MVYKRLYKSFKKFIDQDTYFSEIQQDQIIESFNNEKNKKIFRLSIILSVWSIFGITIDSLIIGGSIVGVIVGGLSWIYLIPTVVFSIVNFLIKSTFVRWYMKNDIPIKQILLSAIPYAGSASIIAYLVFKDPLYGAGLQHYLKYLRTRGIRKIYALLFFKKTS